MLQTQKDIISNDNQASRFLNNGIVFYCKEYSNLVTFTVLLTDSFNYKPQYWFHLTSYPTTVNRIINNFMSLGRFKSRKLMGFNIITNSQVIDHCIDIRFNMNCKTEGDKRIDEYLKNFLTNKFCR